jgi:glycosyltransferase involved in cell wall biosynthesis
VTLDYLSPLPPVRSGIADYSVDLLPSLMAMGDVRVLGLPGQPVDPAVAERFGVVPAEEARPSAGTGGWRAAPRLALYQMGNNRHHAPVQAIALERPGVLVLHDLVLHHLLSEETLGERDFAAYCRRLAADHGWIGEAAAAPRAWGARVEAMLFELPAHRTLLRSQRGVLVHNRRAAESISQEDPEVRVAVVPMGLPLPPPGDPGAGREFRRRFGVPEEAPVLGSYGFQTPIKRTARAVEALATPALSRVHLLVVGEVLAASSRRASERLAGTVPERADDLLELARELGVADRVHVTGFVAPEDFGPSIAACDLALNLRYPTAGETSASLLRVMALGRPAVVSEYAQFAELPDGVVVKVPLAEDGGEVESLARELAGLLTAPERLAAMGEAAREHVRRHHDPAAAAGAIWAACREWARAEPPGDRPAVPPPPTSLTRERLPGRLEWLGPPEPWPAGELRSVTLSVTNRGPARWLAAHRGPGGIALQVSLVAGGRDFRAASPWLPLPRDLDPGESHRFRVDLRRPPGAATLRAAARIMGGTAPGTTDRQGLSRDGAVGGCDDWGGPVSELSL